MDPLSITASSIAIATLVTQVISAFDQLRGACQTLPGRLHALNNDVVDLNAILRDVEAAAAHPSGLTHHQQTTILPVLKRLRGELTNLEGILLVLTSACSRTKIPLIQARQWSKVQRKLQLLQENIRTQKSNLLITLGSSISQNLLHVRLDLTAITLNNNANSDIQKSLSQAVQENTAAMAGSIDVNERLNERLAKLESMMSVSEGHYQQRQKPLVGSEARQNSSIMIPTKQRAGNVEGLRDLFVRGLASPRDICESRGYTLLKWALYEGHFELCKFLMHAGADPDYYTPFASGKEDYFYHSTTDRAHALFLSNGVPPGGEETLRLITRESDFFEDADFTLIHEAVLGLATISLATAIEQHPDDVDTRDRGGRTPLSWAAVRRDEAALALLLLHGADPNAVGHHGVTPLYDACAPEPYDVAASAECCRLLLEAGAKPDPIRPPDAKSCTPLMLACYNGMYLAIVQTLLDYNANPNSTAPDGRTALHVTSRRDRSALAQMLLEAGADINVATPSQETPLTAAIVHNSHGTLRLLLDRWFECSECPRLKGPNLLSLVATYADVETINLLIGTNHLRLKYDITYSSEEYMKQLLARSNGDEKLHLAFGELLAIINERPPTCASSESVLESGLRYQRHSKREYPVPGGWQDTESDEDEWLDGEDEAFKEALTVDLDLG